MGTEEELSNKRSANESSSTRKNYFTINGFILECNHAFTLENLPI